MTTNEAFLLVMVLILALPYAVWRVLNAPNLFPLVVVQILCGLALGPGVFGAIMPELHATLFRPEVMGSLNGLAVWAVVLFVFLAGLELNLADLRDNRFETGVTAGLALGVPLALGAVAAAVFMRDAGWAGAGLTGAGLAGAGLTGDRGAHWQLILAIGMSCAVTALPILVLFLDRLGILNAALGQRVLRYASLDDIAIWAVLAIILLDWDRVARQAIFAVGFIAAAWVMRRVFTRLTNRWPVALIWMTACAFLADWAGLHYMVGAFVAGMVLDAAWLPDTARLRDTVLSLLMPVFFLSTGLRTDWQMGGPAVFGLAAVLLIVAVVGKLVGVHLAGRILNWPAGQATQIGWLLQTKALVTIVFANVLLDKGVISSASFTALLLMAISSTMLTMPMLYARRK